MDDIPRIQGELYAALVLSSHAHANITVDYSDAVKMEGVKGYIGVEDVPGNNCTGECRKTWFFHLLLYDVPVKSTLSRLSLIVGIATTEAKALLVHNWTL